jgi:hypothetical protein
MNEMYSMGLSIHSIGAVGLLGVVFINILALMNANELAKYRRLMSIVLMPLSSMAIGIALFTGMVMMAAKHLDFTLENIVMIIIGVVLIILEAKRAKMLRYLNSKKERALEAYKPFGLKILYVEFILITLISLWMWFL